MKSDQDFFSFLLNHYYDQIFDKVKSFLIQHREDLAERFFGGQKCWSVELEEIEIKQIHIENRGNGKISFDIALMPDASVCVSEGHDSIEKEEIGRLWLSVNCNGNIYKRLRDFCIDYVDYYDGENPSNKPLDKYLVPYVRKENYEKYAKEILEKYYPEALNEEKVFIEPMKLVGRMGINYLERRLSPDFSIFGQYYFEPCSARFYDEAKKTFYQENIPARTIVLDPLANNRFSLGSRSITVIHECVHAYMHELAFCFLKMLNENFNHIDCENEINTENVFSSKTINFMERQANGIAPLVLMPREKFISEAKKQIAISHSIGFDELEYMPFVIDSLASKFGVTSYAARKRLIELGFKDAIGSKNYMDGAFLRPYQFSKGFLKENETLSLSQKDFFKLADDPFITKLFYQNAVVFVENHICLNEKKYLRKNMLGENLLTDYARRHMDECCLKFSYTTSDNLLHDNLLVSTNYLCRDLKNGMSLGISIKVNDKDISNNQNIKAVMYAKSEEIQEIDRIIAGKTFYEALVALTKYRNLTHEDLAINSGLDKKTIDRYLSAINKRPDMRTVIAICRGLNLPPESIETIFSLAGLAFQKHNLEHDNLRFVTMYMGDCTLEEVNHFLEETGFAPLTKPKK